MASNLVHEVLGVDTDTRKIDALAIGRAPFYSRLTRRLLGAGENRTRLFTPEGIRKGCVRRRTVT